MVGTEPEPEWEGVSGHDTLEEAQAAKAALGRARGAIQDYRLAEPRAGGGVMTWRELADFERDVRETEANYFAEEESEQQARERMTPVELAAELDWIAARYGIPAADLCPEEKR